MSRSPEYKVFNALGRYQAAVKEIEAAACLMSLYGSGATIRFGHSSAWTLWREGSEDRPASESYDNVAMTCLERLGKLERAALRRVRNRRPKAQGGPS